MRLTNWGNDERIIELETTDGYLRLQPITDGVIRCIYTKHSYVSESTILVPVREREKTAFQVEEQEKLLCIRTEKICLEIEKEGCRMCWKEAKNGRIYLQEAGKSLTEIDVVKYTTGGEEPVINRVKTVDGERNFIENLKPEVVKKAYRGQLKFEFQEKEGIYGLGQGEEGIYNYRGHVQYLYQHNMRIPMPILLSSRKYGIFVDCGSLMTFNDDERGSYLYLDTVNQMDYYFMAGENIDEIIGSIRELTGRSTMLPKWAYGYIQSKEQYYTSNELVEVAEHYRQLQVPLDCVVQDWNSWEPGNWGEKILDKKRYGNMQECAEKLKELRVHSMVSVWPNMNTGGKNHTELFDKGCMLNDYSTYDAFDDEAREIYWKQAQEGLFDEGFDSWWCDSTEPFSGPDWGGEIKREPWERYLIVGNEHKKYLDADKANLFALMHAKGIYENQRKTTEEKRVLNLTRSGYVSGSQYGAVLWSGDIYASWEVMKSQIAEGLNVGMSGYPYWTLDIGGFFTVGEKWQNRGCGCNGDSTSKWFWCSTYDEGIHDKGYCELYTRWLQFGCFLPMFRSHGTDTPREIWNFGEKGTMFYDVIEKFIHLRYTLMPYIYSLAGNVWRNHGTIMRSLLFDFIEDEEAQKISDEYMFGPSLLVCPVTEPMYYEAGNHPIDREKTRSCYLPSGCDWYDFWNNQHYTGGRYVTVEAPLDKMPLFVRAGSILPVAEGMQYADDKSKNGITFRIYPGADADFTLYEDEGNNYNFERGAYALTRVTWNEETQEAVIGETQGSYPDIEFHEGYHVVVIK